MYMYVPNKEFTLHIIEANVMVLPGRVPGYKSSDIQLLPSSTTKQKKYGICTKMWHVLTCP